MPAGVCRALLNPREMLTFQLLFIAVHIVNLASPAEIVSRHTRQLNSCSPLNEFECSNGQCIDSLNLCDGAVHCDDGSDETISKCSKPNHRCPSYSFKCAYGACVNGDAMCNGVKDCADNSDELLFECRSSQNSSTTQTKCNLNSMMCDSGECIDTYSFCDGHSDCADDSDETISYCINIGCPSSAFRCAYGACIDMLLKCNGVPDCHDGSDEGPELCKGILTPKPTTQRPPSSTRKPLPFNRPKGTCFLPDHPENGRYTVFSNDDTQIDQYPELTQAIPGADVPPNANIYLQFSCDPGYAFKSSNDVEIVSTCIKGTWHKIPKCEKLCPPLLSNTLDLHCVYLGEEHNCSIPARPTTEVIAKCKPGFKLKDFETSFHSTECKANGEWWRNLFSCFPTCGVGGDTSLPLISHGSPSKIGQFPWHVGIFAIKDNGSLSCICGGTIINQFAVVTAAHCTHHNAQDFPLPPSKFKITAGKLSSDWNKREPNEFRASVHEIAKPTSFHGSKTHLEGDIAVLILSEPFPFSNLIMPICMDWNLTTQKLSGLTGTISGWGKDETFRPSEHLQYTRMKYMDHLTCYNNSPESFKKYIINDKFCATYENGAEVGEGDSGGGFIVNHNGRHILAGLVSLKPTRGTSFSVFTNLVNFLTWLKKVIEATEVDPKLRRTPARHALQSHSANIHM